MALGLFDHVKAITQKQDPKYWDTLEEADKKNWSTYMIFRFLSMKSDWVEIVADLQPYLQEAPPKAVYLALIDILPKTREFLRYTKPKGEDKYEKWLVDLVALKYEVPKIEAEDYLKILYSIENGNLKIKEIAQSYGVDEKIIKKLKLGV
jgi:hypothetical protein